MRNIIFRVVIILILMGIVISGESNQTIEVNEIVKKCAEAMGGMEKIDEIKTMRFKVTYPGHDYVVTTDIQRPNLMRNSGGRGIGIFDGKNGCVINKDPKTGKFDHLKMITDDFLADFYVEPGFFTFYFFDFPTTLIGMSMINGKNYHQLEVKLPLKAAIHYYIDAETFLPLRCVAHVTFKGKKVQWGRDYIEYKKIQGILYPHNFLYSYGEKKKEQATVKSVTLNVKFPEDHFTIPVQK